MKIEIYEDYSDEGIAIVSTLFTEYATSLGFPLDFQDFDSELEHLPDEYAPPEGCIFLCKIEDNIVGCIALRKLEPGICELKRMYVRDEYRRKGIGKKLAEEVMKRAKEIGYEKMRLDTLSSMTNAITIYEELGFKEIGAYRYNPLENAMYMEKEL